MFSSFDPALLDFKILLFYFISIFLMVLSWIIVNWNTLFRRPMTDHEVLEENIRRINRLLSQGEIIEAYRLARDLGILNLWDWRETLDDIETFINQLISRGKLRSAQVLAHWWGIQDRWNWDEIILEDPEYGNQEENRTELQEQN